MRSIVAAALWMIVGFGVTEFVADLLQIWRIERSPMVAEAAEPRDEVVLTHFFQPAPNYRPARFLRPQ